MYEGATDWLTEKITGVKKIEGVSISDKKYAELFAGGMQDFEDDPERTALEGRTYTKKALESFEKGKKYEELKSIIGENNYIDNSHQTPEEILAILIASTA